MTAFIESLRGAARPVIAEIKRRDANGNDLLGGRPLAELVASYEAAGAPCLSVVTGRWFGGTGDMLAEVAGLTSLPLLQKDFITRRGQLRLARERGASAVLLTAGLLAKSTLRSLIEHSLLTGLTPFVEVTTEAECTSVPHAGSCAVAVNNKDITARERGAADLGRSLALLPAVMRSGTRCAVSAGGIDSPQTAASLVGAGFTGLLIGTGLLRGGDLGCWFSQFDRGRAAPPGAGPARS